MPNLDGGHYFFTALIPIDNRGIVEHAGLKSSPVHMVRDALEALPTALQSPASEKIGIQSPFAKSLRTHFARLFVLDAPNYNGRDPQDSIITALPISKTDLLKPQPVDGLATPHLVFVADFDPQGVEPHSWLEELWALARPELCSVFEYCYGFDPAFDGGAFARYVVQGQVETTMPFNDYWSVPPVLPSLSLLQLAVAPALGLIAGVVLGAMAGWPWWAIAILAFGVGGVMISYQLVMAAGARSFPTAPHSTLRHVLKALYLQQAFARFAADNQGAAPTQLRAAFERFVADVRLDDLDGPTQPPGVIRSARGA
jgi:hypothetical protein